jgi:AAA family ATP:ADP antiporter
VSLLIIALTGCWIYLALRVRREYLNSFRRAIEKRTINPEELTHDVQAAVHADDLIRLLESRHERQVIFALGFFETMKDERLAESLRRLIDFPSTEVKRRVLRLASAIPGLDLTMQANLLVAEGSENLRISAMRYLCSRNEHKEELIRFYLSDDDVQVRSAAILCAAREWVEDANVRKAVSLTELFSGLCGSVMEISEDSNCHPLERVAFARAIGIAAQPVLYNCLSQLIDDPEDEIKAAAAISAGRTRDSRFVGSLIGLLSNQKVRRQAREALSEYGESIGDVLHERLHDQTTHFRIRLEIPRVLAMIGAAASVDILAHHLDEPNTALRYEVIRSLNKIRKRDPDLKLKTRAVNERIAEETRHYYEILLILHRHRQLAKAGSRAGQNNSIGIARQLLIRALQEKLDANLDRIFRLLGLKHVPRDMYNAYLGIVSDIPDLRATTVELLDLILDPDLKPAILPLAESNDEAALVRKGRELYASEIPSEAECISILLQGDDDWLRVCTLYLIAQLPDNTYNADVQGFESHSNPVVRETAQFVSHKKGITPPVDVKGHHADHN